MRIVAVGDLMLGDSSVCVGMGFAARWARHGLEPVFRDVRDHWSEADVVFGNVEAVLSSAGLARRRWRSAQMRGPSRFATDLRQVGFDIVSVANNHCCQHGQRAFHDMVASLRRAGLEVCGLRGPGEWTASPSILTGPDGARVGFLGYSLRPNQWGEDPPPYACGSPEAILADVRRLRDECGRVCVSLHWGDEFVRVPSSGEVDLGHAIIDAGAVALIGHHPHVARPVERYRHGVIAYSLGNFVGDQTWHASLREGLLLDCVATHDRMDKVVIWRTWLGEDFRPTLVGEPTPADSHVHSLASRDYGREVEVQLGVHRRARYRFLLRRGWRSRAPHMVVQLLAVTARNKAAALFDRLGGASRV